MSAYVADTHAIYWHLADDPRLSPAARRELEQADAGFNRVYIPGIVLIEMAYLVEKGRLDHEPVDRLFEMLDVIDGGYAVAPLDQGIARALQSIPRVTVPDMPDRIVVATALQLGLPLISRDEAIYRSGVVRVIW